MISTILTFEKKRTQQKTNTTFFVTPQLRISWIHR